MTAPDHDQAVQRVRAEAKRLAEWHNERAVGASFEFHAMAATTIANAAALLTAETEARKAAEDRADALQESEAFTHTVAKMDLAKWRAKCRRLGEAYRRLRLAYADTVAAGCESMMVKDAALDLEHDRADQAEARATKAEGLLRRAVKYAHEDRMRTPGTTRLARVLDEARAALAGEGGSDHG